MNESPNRYLFPGVDIYFTETAFILIPGIFSGSMTNGFTSIPHFLSLLQILYSSVQMRLPG